MTYFKTILLVLGLILFVSSCIKEDTADCEVSTIQLNFKYFADVEHDVIEKYIKKISLFIYNEETGLLIDEKELLISKKSDTYIGLSHLPIGTYKLITWGNLNNLSKLNGTNDVAKASVRIKESTIDLSRLTSSDRLYYSQTKIRVENQGQINQDIVMSAAHIQFDVFVKGIIAPPILVLNQFVAGFDMKKQEIDDSSKLFNPILKPHGDEYNYRSQFTILRPNQPFSTESLSLITRDGTIYELNLGTYLNKYYPEYADFSHQEMKVNILFEFSDLGVQITIPDWDIEEGSGSVID